MHRFLFWFDEFYGNVVAVDVGQQSRAGRRAAFEGNNGTILNEYGDEMIDEANLEINCPTD